MMTGRTHLDEVLLAELRATGRTRRGRFVDPVVMRRCGIVLDQRGEVWAASVLGRSLERRSIAVPTRPYLNAGEEHTLILADAAEDAAALDRLGMP